MINKYRPDKIEPKWQKIWEKNKTNQTDLGAKKPKHYNLVMFPYPSGEFLHIGHAYSYSGADVYGRFKMLSGFNVFEPIGYDSFGLPAENFAINHGVHPKVSTKANIEHAEKQLKNFGCMFDWSKAVNTSSPDYYKWTQWIFLKLFEKGLAYQKEAPVNWCPKCLTVLANEQVIEGKCERCESEIIQKNMKQWFFKITDYAERLIKDLDKVDWPQSSVIKQRNWIGKSEGVEFEMEIVGHKEKISIYTTRIDTVFGMTYVVLAPEHEIISKIVTSDKQKEVEKYIEGAKKKTEIERESLEKEKTGVFTGAYAINPFNNKKIPIWVADYVVLSYGTGAVMAVPAHDERDFEFASKYKLPIVKVVIPPAVLYFPRNAEDIAAGAKSDLRVESDCYTEDGELVNSGSFSGLTSRKAREKMAEWLKKKKLGKCKVNYRLRDWSFSRQRYWGAPIPIIYCQKCGTVPVPEKDLPVLLPEIRDFRPKGTGKGPLASNPKFVNTKCPKCGGKAQRETDTMDTFVCSSFYFLRYPSVPNDKEMMEKEVTKKWLPVDMYVGGAEHVTMHLLYARFVTKALYDMKLINFDEPFLALRHQGMILGPDGRKMSKSKGNVIIPDEIIKNEGADVFRMYILFMGPFEDGGPWNPKGLVGIKRFLWQKVWRVFNYYIKGLAKGKIKNIKGKSKLIHKTIRKVTENISHFRFNTAISTLMTYFNERDFGPKIDKKGRLEGNEVDIEALEKFLILLAPFVPHFAEELWARFGHKESIFKESWPKYDEKLIKEEKFILVVQVDGRVRDKIEVDISISEDEAKKLAFGSEKVKRFVAEDKVKKIIYIPGKLISIATK